MHQDVKWNRALIFLLARFNYPLADSMASSQRRAWVIKRPIVCFIPDHAFVVSPGEVHILSLCFSFLTCKMEVRKWTNLCQTLWEPWMQGANKSKYHGAGGGLKENGEWFILCCWFLNIISMFCGFCLFLGFIAVLRLCHRCLPFTYVPVVL